MSKQQVLHRTTPGPLHCPSCAGTHTGVIASRPKPNGTVRRRYWCAACDHRWTTYEIPNDRPDAAPVDIETLCNRWLYTHDIRAMGKRAVEETATNSA